MLEIVKTEVMDKEVFQVRCMACGATGIVNYNTDTPARAVQAWNSRASFRTYAEVNYYCE